MAHWNLMPLKSYICAKLGFLLNGYVLKDVKVLTAQARLGCRMKVAAV